MAGRGLFSPPEKGLLRRPYILVFAQAAAFLLSWILYNFVADVWSLFRDQPILWVVQIIAIIEIWEITAEGIATLNVTHKARLALIIALLNWVLVFVFVIQEVSTCASLESAEIAAQRDCRDSISRTISSSSVLVCQADVDVSTSATGVCPQVAFGETGGIFWIIFQILLCLGYIVSDFVLLYDMDKVINKQARMLKTVEPKVNPSVAPATRNTLDTKGAGQDNSSITRGTANRIYASKFAFGP
jgi:hypothetical protein